MPVFRPFPSRADYGLKDPLAPGAGLGASQQPFSASRKVDDLSRHESKHNADPKQDPKKDPNHDSRHDPKKKPEDGNQRARTPDPDAGTGP